MTRCPGRPALLALALAGALTASPASAQVSSFLDGLFGRKSQPEAPAPEAAPAPAAREPAAAAPAGREPNVAQTGAVPARVPLPPRRPAALARADAPEAAPDAQTATSASPRTQLAAVGSPAPIATADDAIVRANQYFNGISTLVGDFVQIGPDGRKVGGKLYVSRPGRLRFDYDAPSTLEVVADGSSVVVRDRRLNTSDAYPISQTPLKFLVRERIDLASDLKVTGVESEAGGIRVSVEDWTAFGGTSRITLYFDAEMRQLSQWRITDPQGYQTTVMLSNLQRGRAVDPRLFTVGAP
jgi:outer membrane lipoprotein-sorting protein